MKKILIGSALILAQSSFANVKLAFSCKPVEGSDTAVLAAKTTTNKEGISILEITSLPISGSANASKVSTYTITKVALNEGKLVVTSLNNQVRTTGHVPNAKIVIESFSASVNPGDEEKTFPAQLILTAGSTHVTPRVGKAVDVNCLVDLVL